MKCRPALTVIAAALVAAGCWEIGDPVPDDALVTWAAFPDTVVAGETFSFEWAGPVSPNTCGHLDTTRVVVEEDGILLSASRTVFPDALCSRDRVSFYEARAMEIERPGVYPVRSAEGLELGTLVVLEEGQFSRMRTFGEGTVRRGGGCLLFGPGWLANQRPFALVNAPPELHEAADTDAVIELRGTIRGFSLCGGLGSRPSIRVSEAHVTDRTGEDYYRDRKF